MDNWEIVDSKGTIHSGPETEMRFAMKVMMNPDDFSKKAKEKYYVSWKGDLRLIQIHQIHR